MEGGEVPDVLALDGDPEADERAVDLGDPEAVRVVAERARAEGEEALRRRRRVATRAPSRGSRARCAIASRTTSYVGRESSGVARRIVMPCEAIGCSHLGHPR